MLFIFLPDGIVALSGVTTTVYPELMPLVVPLVMVTSCALLAVEPAFTVQLSGIDDIVTCLTTGRMQGCTPLLNEVVIL